MSLLLFSLALWAIAIWMLLRVRATAPDRLGATLSAARAQAIFDSIRAESLEDE